ncbi:universal stress protein UspA [Aliikangiella marina]|uniref:Universal stress protein UspA n=1 Tax=Aliikangiella marina TaxID=1712262 RepID=A0A545TIQ4_9GAMM|nr:universal stress protein [Aliikangiella marina]TQV77061.1 universal stress protein UspA [Aliikangiella marina]
MRELLVIADRDGTQQPAFHHALEVAKNTGAAIEFVGFVHAPGVDSSDILTHEEKRKVHHSYIDNKQKEIEDFLSTIDAGDVKIHTDVVWEKSFERWVIARCDQRSFDMVYKSGHRSETFMYTPSDWQLMRHCPEPVMIVGNQPWREGGVILAALDLGSDSQRSLTLNEDILRQAIKLAKATNSEMHACYSIAIPKALADLDLIDPAAYESKMRANLDPVIRKLVDEAGLNRDKLHLLSGRPAKEICRISEKIKADVVVLGNKTRTSLRGRLLGNTAEDVLHTIQADVVVIK